MHLPLVDRWATGSQQRSRRNAMTASTRLTQRRAEAREVEDLLASLGRRVPDATAQGTAGPVAAAR